MAGIHCKSHQEENDPPSRGHRLADQAAKEAAGQSIPEAETIPQDPVGVRTAPPSLPIKLTKRIHGPCGGGARGGGCRDRDLRKPAKPILLYSQTPHPVHAELCVPGIMPVRNLGPVPGYKQWGRCPLRTWKLTEVRACQGYPWLPGPSAAAGARKHTFRVGRSLPHPREQIAPGQWLRLCRGRRSAAVGCALQSNLTAGLLSCPK